MNLLIDFVYTARLIVAYARLFQINGVPVVDIIIFLWVSSMGISLFRWLINVITKTAGYGPVYPDDSRHGED